MVSGSSRCCFSRPGLRPGSVYEDAPIDGHCFVVPIAVELAGTQILRAYRGKCKSACSTVQAASNPKIHVTYSESPGAHGYVALVTPSCWHERGRP
jgi:hypothetical protein